MQQNSTIRTPWPDAFPPVFVHCGWREEAAVRLGDHTRYWAAKKRRNADAALAVCRDLCREDVWDAVFDACDGTALRPVVVAPALSLDESQNALAIGYGRWLAAEMGWEVDREIFQSRCVGRDFVTDVSARATAEFLWSRAARSSLCDRR